MSRKWVGGKPRGFARRDFRAFREPPLGLEQGRFPSRWSWLGGGGVDELCCWGTRAEMEAASGAGQLLGVSSLHPRAAQHPLGVQSSWLGDTGTESFALEDVLSVPGLKEQLPVQPPGLGQPPTALPCCEQSLHCPCEPREVCSGWDSLDACRDTTRKALPKAAALHLSGMAQSHLGGLSWGFSLPPPCLLRGSQDEPQDCADPGAVELCLEWWGLCRALLLLGA